MTWPAGVPWRLWWRRWRVVIAVVAVAVAWLGVIGGVWAAGQPGGGDCRLAVHAETGQRAHYTLECR